MPELNGEPLLWDLQKVSGQAKGYWRAQSYGTFKRFLDRPELIGELLLYETL